MGSVEGESCFFRYFNRLSGSVAPESNLLALIGTAFFAVRCCPETLVVQCVACIFQGNIVDRYLNLGNAQHKCASAPLSVFHRCRPRLRGKVIAADRWIRNALHCHFIRVIKRNAGNREVVVEVNTGMIFLAGR